MAHLWMSHVAYVNESCRTYEWVMSHIWISHVTHMNESCYTYELVSCHTYEWVMSRIWKKPCRTYECVMSHIWMSHVAHMNESCRTYKRVMHTSHVAHMKESCRTYECILSYIWINLRGCLRAWAPLRWLRICEWVTSGDRGYVVTWLGGEWQFPLKMLHTWNPPNRETQIPRYLAVQIQIEMLIWRAAAEVLQPRSCRVSSG